MKRNARWKTTATALMAAPCAALAACNSSQPLDDGAAGSTSAASAGAPAGITCGPGTRLVGNQCEVDEGSDAGGSSAGPGGSAATVGGSAGTAGSGATVGGSVNTAGDAGSNGGGGAPPNGGSGPVGPGGSGGVALCGSGFEDCNGDATDGCETDLTNDATNCGSCGNACAAEWTCFSGVCLQRLAEDQSNSRALAVDATDVYWCNWGTRDFLNNYNLDGAIVKLPLDGGAISTLADNQNEPVAIAVDDTHVYWANGSTSGEVLKIPKDGGDPVSLAAGMNRPRGLVIDDTHVYWIESTDADTGDDAIVRVRKDGTELSPVVSGWSWVYQIAVGSAEVYWVQEVEGGIFKAPLDGSAAPSVLYGGVYLPEGIATDSTEVFWTENVCEPSSVRKVAVDGGEATNLAEMPGCNPSDLVVDEEHVYWLMANGAEDDWESGSVVKTPKEPAPSVVLVEGQGNPRSIAIDDAFVYWINLDWTSGMGEVLRIEK